MGVTTNQFMKCAQHTQVSRLSPGNHQQFARETGFGIGKRPHTITKNTDALYAEFRLADFLLLFQQ